MNKNFKKLSDLKYEFAEYYVSADLEETKKIFNSDIPFEVLKFNYDPDRSDILVKYPDNPYFIQVANGGQSSWSCGNSSTHNFHNPYKEKSFGADNPTLDRLYIQKSLAMIETTLSINFLKLDARESIQQYDEKPKNLNVEHLRNILGNGYYLEYPDLYRKEYLVDISKLGLEPSTGVDAQYLLIAAPKYEYSYEKLKAYFLNLNGSYSTLKINNVSRARDGGTTHIDLETVTGRKYRFYSPTPFRPQLDSTLNDDVVGVIDDKEITSLTLKVVGLKETI